MYQIGLTGTRSVQSRDDHSSDPPGRRTRFRSTASPPPLPWQPPSTNDSLAVTLQLPPLVTTMTARLDASSGPAKGRVQGGFASPPTGILPQPLVVNASLDFSPGFPFSASEELQFDVSGSVLTRATSQIGLGGLSGTFVAQNTGIPNQLVPATVKVGYEGNCRPAVLLEGRVKVVPGLKTHWYLNFQNYIDNLSISARP